MKPAQAIALACSLLPALTPAAARAPDSGGVQLTAGSSLQYDSNLFRLPDGVAPAQAGFAAGARRHDLIVTPFAQLDGQLHGGTQTLSARARVTRDLFVHNDTYDATRYDGEATWRGEFTRRWRSEIGYALEQRVTSFADLRNPERNLLEASSARFGLSFVPRPDTRLSAFATDFRGSNSLAVRRVSDYRVRLVRVELARSSAHGHEVSIGAGRTDGRFPNREVVGTAPIDNSYRQNLVAATFVWRAGAATAATLRAGHVERDYPIVPERGYQGPTWLASVSWQAGGKTLLRLATQRDLNAVDDFDRIYSVSDVHRASLTHSLSAKLALGFELSRQRVDYAGDPENFLTLLFGQRPARADRIDEARLSLVWTPRERWQVQVALADSQRDSNQPGLQYRSRSAHLALQYRAF